MDRRGKIMLFVAWICSFICSVPQAIIFHLDYHPNITWYQQCVTYNFFQEYWQEITYSLMGMMFMYALPLIVIIFCYASIYFELLRKSKKCITGEQCSRIASKRGHLKLLFLCICRTIPKIE